MSGLITQMEDLLTDFVLICTMLMEIIGVCVLVQTAVKCFIRWLKKDGNCRLELAEGIALALEFKMGGEVLRTVAVREWSELGILGAIIALRRPLPFLSPWEIKNGQKVRKREQQEAEG